MAVLEGVIRVGLQAAGTDAVVEAARAERSWPPFNSAHEGYAVILEELDELWAHVKANQKQRDVVAMRKEAVQVAAMALRFIANVCDEQRGEN
jgi:hypothetical protein